MATLLEVLQRAQELGYLGPGPVQAHVEHARGLAEVVAELPDGPPAAFCDLGSGGGVPGLVLAEAWPRSRATLLEGSARRSEFLRGAVGTLGLAPRVTVAEGRAEVLARDPELEGAFPVVTARSFGPPAAVAECAARLLSPGGRLVVAEPPAGLLDTRERWPEEGLELLGLELERPSSSDPGRPAVAVIRAVAPCPRRFPRRVGVPGKRPLF